MLDLRSLFDATSNMTIDPLEKNKLVQITDAYQFLTQDYPQQLETIQNALEYQEQQLITFNHTATIARPLSTDQNKKLSQDQENTKELVATASQMHEEAKETQEQVKAIIMDPRADLNLSKSQEIVANITPENITGSITDLTSTMTETNQALTVSLQKVTDAKQIFIKLGYEGKFDDLTALNRFFRNKSLELHPDKQAKKSVDEKEQAQADFKDLSTARDILQDPASLQTLQNTIQGQEQLLLELKEKLEDKNIPIESEEKEKLVSITRGIQDMNLRGLEDLYTPTGIAKAIFESVQQKLSAITSWLKPSNEKQQPENTTTSDTTATETTNPDTVQEPVTAQQQLLAKAQEKARISEKLLVNFQHQTMKIIDTVLEPSLQNISTILNPQRGRWARLTNADLTPEEKDIMVEKIQSQIIDPFQNTVKQLYNPTVLDQMRPDDQKALKKYYEKTLDGYKDPIIKYLQNYKVKIISSNPNLADAIDEIANKLELTKKVQNYSGYHEWPTEAQHVATPSHSPYGSAAQQLDNM